MYSNTPTLRAIQFITEHLRRTAYQFNNVPVEALCEALRIIMTSNAFTFGDTFWKQFKGTAMGTPPSPPWTNIYYSLCEGHFLPLFQENLVFYKRFIDDVLGIWIVTDPATNSKLWASFQRHMNEELYGLEWIVSPPSQKVYFMDLTLSIFDNKIVTTLYEKPSNFHLYIPPHSSHPPGLLRGMAHGMINRIHTLCSAEDDKRARTIKFFRHLQRRGYQPKNLIPLFSRAIKRAREYADSPPPQQATKT
jgi:hypothetical protein